MEKIFKLEGVDMEWLGPLLTYTILGAIIGARLGHCLFYDWAYFKHHLLEILLPVEFEPQFRFTGFRGLASHGGAIGVITALYLWSKKVSKKPILWILDRLVVPTALAGVFIRLGNLMNSEIVGSITNVPWAFEFAQSYPGELRHPVQLYEAISYVFLFVLLWRLFFKSDKKNYQGYIFGVYMVGLWSLRFVLEFFKNSQGGLEKSLNIGLSTGQLLSIPLILVGIYFMNRAKKK